MNYLSSCFYSQSTRLGPLLFSLSRPPLWSLGTFGWCTQRLRAAARLIGGVPKFGHIGEFMRDTLHWLPVRQHILYRVSTIAWRCILGVAPAYLSKLLSYLRPVRVSDHFVRPLAVTIWYHVLTRTLNRIGPSRRLVPLSGMAFLSNCAHFHVIFRARLIVSFRPSFLPGPGLGAILSSHFEGALYKFRRQIDRYM